MFPAAPLLSTLLLCASVIATPVKIRDSPIKLAISRKINVKGTTIADADRARAAALLSRASSAKKAHRDVISVTVENQAVTYVANVGVGTPPTQYSLIIDTGSSNTWVGATQPFVQTSSTVQTADSVAVQYGSGDFSGTEFTDTVTLGDGLVITNQSIGVADQSDGFQGVDGILGLGPVDLTVGTLSPDQNTPIPTVTDNLFAQGTIDANEVGISFEPTTSEVADNGELTFGGTDSSKFTGDITFVPITSTSPASLFWGIDQSITYGSADGTTILASTAGIVDTGTTLVLLATDAFQTYVQQTGAVLDQTTGLLRLTSAQFDNLQSLFFNVGDTSFELTPNAQLWPRSLNEDIGGTADDIFLIVGDFGTDSGQGLDFINGFAFLERFYSIFDTANQQVGLATTPFTDATTN